MKIEIIIFSNIAEAFENTINKIKNSKQKKDRIAIEHNLCDRTLLWEGDNKLVITPFEIPKNIFNLNKTILGFKNVKNLFPDKIDISLSDATRKDKAMLKNLCDIIAENPGVRISPYCVTEKFIDLIEYLKFKGLVFSVLEIPKEESRWLVMYLDSKIGSRAEIGRIKSVSKNVPEGIICKNEKEVIKVAIWFYKNGCSCALKSNFGESGWGTLFIKKEDFKNEIEIEKYIKKEFKIDAIWKNELTLVEEYVTTNKKLFNSSPSSELFLSDKGAEITYLCDQVMGNKGDFLGVALGKNLLNKKVDIEIRKISLEIGKRFWKLGYRGFFDIDFMLSNDNVACIIETNMRRTGGTHVYDFAKTLFGSNWEEKCFILSQDSFCYGNKRLNEKQIIDKIKKLMYPIKGGKEGVFISIINKWEPTLGFIIASESKKRTLIIRDKMLKIWKIKK